MTRNTEMFIMGPRAATSSEDNIFKGATVAKISLNASTSSMELVLQEKWILSDSNVEMQAFIYEKSTFRAHGIAQNQHY